MSWVMAVLTLLFVLQTIKMRGKLKALDLVVPSGEPLDSRYRLLMARDRCPNNMLLGAAGTYMNVHGIDMLELIPGNLSTEVVLLIANTDNPASFNNDLFQTNNALSYATVISSEVYEKA